MITQEKITLPHIKLVGITVRTNNKDEMNPLTGKIPLLIQRYAMEGIPAILHHRKNPGTTYCAYTDYESDATGDYTYFIGEEVTSFDDNLTTLETLTIPEQTYVKFTNGPGAMPMVCIDVWMKIWGMNASDLGGKRCYTTDFELYDERAHNPYSATLDIYIGIEKEVNSRG